jgi:RNA polymerase sigma-B factor
MVRVPRDLQELSVRIASVVDELTADLGRVPTAAEIADHCGTTIERVLEARAMGTAHRALSLDAPADDDEESPSVSVAVEDPGFAHAERSADLDRLLASLTERERLILRLRFQDDLPQHEIGARLGISQMHVSRLIRTAIARLQQHESASEQRAETRFRGLRTHAGILRAGN